MFPLFYGMNINFYDEMFLLNNRIEIFKFVWNKVKKYDTLISEEKSYD